MSVYRPSTRYDLPREIKADAITAKTTSFMLLVTEKTRGSIPFAFSSPELRVPSRRRGLDSRKRWLLRP